MSYDRNNENTQAMNHPSTLETQFALSMAQDTRSTARSRISPTQPSAGAGSYLSSFSAGTAMKEILLSRRALASTGYTSLNLPA